MGKNDENEVKKEASWVIGNAIAEGTVEQVSFIIECQCIQPLCEMLGASVEPKMQSVAMNSLERMLKLGQEKQQQNHLSENPIVSLIDQAEGPEKLEALQYVQNTEICDKACD